MGRQTVGRGPTYRAALLAVILLSIFLLAGVILLVIGFMRQYRIYSGRSRGDAPAVIRLAPGAHIVAVETEAGKLIVHVATPQGREVEVMDLASGKLISRIEETAR